MKSYELKKDVLYEQLKEAIFSGKYPAEMKLPKELDFAKELGVAKVTLRAALSRLEEEGLILRIHGKGTFINKEQRQKGILVVVKDLGVFANPSVYILEGIKKAAIDQHFTVTTVEMEYVNSLSGDELRHYADANNITGIIILSGYFLGHEKIINIIKASALPAVIAAGQKCDTGNTGFASIVVDRQSAWEHAIQYLCEQGHTRIATVIHEGPLQIRGYTVKEHLALLEKYGAENDESLLLHFEHYQRELVRSAVIKMMRATTKPTAILCYSDYYAIYVYEALKEMGLAIPGDVAVMGYCGYPGAQILTPPLSTMDYEYSKIGESALHIINRSSEWFDTDTAIPQVIKKAVLKKRESANIKRFEKEVLHAY